MIDRVAVGLGCRTGASGSSIAALVRAALARLPSQPRAVTLFVTDRKAREPGLREAAQDLGYELVVLPEASLAAVGGRLATHSPRVSALTGVGSVAEAAALVGGGPDFGIVVPRLACGGVACAVAARSGALP